jgi:pyruvate,water dikinase
MGPQGSSKSLPDAVFAFSEPGGDVASMAGGKGASLSRMARAGLPVPAGFVISAAAFQDFLDGCNGSAVIAAILGGLDVDDAEAVERAAGRIRNLIMSTSMPVALARAICDEYEKLGRGGPVAVRSSAVSEDGAAASFAGQQETYLNVHGREALLHRIRECWASFFSPRTLFYRAKKAVLADTRMAVVVQEMVQADKSGVMFTVDPIRGRRDCMVIEGAPGLGEALVSGEITPDHYVISREDGVAVDMFIPDEARGRTLSDAELDALRLLGLKLEAFFGSPQDVEWCIRSGDLFLLQSRAVTTLGAGHG